MSAPAELLALITRFEEQLDSYKSGAYNEAQLRIEFLDPFFKLLGWDMDNTAGYAEAYKDVIHEDAIRIGDKGTKAPDYCFRIGGTRKFFLEAKKPSVYIKEELAPAHQLRSYAWSAKLPLSILSDFEEFAFYDCRVKPKKDDSAATARIFYGTFREYVDKWDEIASIFSREAILKGSFDRFVESTKAKKGTAEFDQDFLETIEGWRKELAQNLALRNPRLTQRELNFAVQRIIDRIIFLRICEARAIEDYGRLRALINGDRIYPRLAQLFEAADARYNSGLFHFKRESDRHEAPDELTLDLNVDDKLLRNIIRGLYYPESPYHFSVVSADILGQVYEQFLGKIIRLTPGHHAVVEDKPEVKKAGGVYYTPTYIVDYIVQQTVGKLVEGRTPKQVEKLRILDPACGSGSFLIGAYQYLLDWHLQYYTAQGAAKFAKGSRPAMVQTASGWKLTIAERKRILLNNIYGVDIDSQAVEVTKLSLLLKVLESETSQSLQSHFTFFHQRALPDLGDNIKCGNSLIGPDFYQQSEFPLLTDEEKFRINVFDWQAEFPDIFKAGGFDAVIGNPPYVRIQGFPADQIAYFSRRYVSAKGNFDLYIPFVERGFQLLRGGGKLGMITPNKFFRTDYGEGLRRALSSSHAVRRIIDFGASQVFTATTYTCLLFLEHGGVERFEVAEVAANVKALAEARFRSERSSSLTSAAWTFENKAASEVLAKLKSNAVRLLDLPADMSRGSSTGDDEVFVIEKGSVPLEPTALRIPLFANDFGRYRFEPSGKWNVIFPYQRGPNGFRLVSEQDLRQGLPKTYRYLAERQTALKRRKQYTEWFGYSAARNLDVHDTAQIAVPLLADRGLFALIPRELWGKLCPMASGGFTIKLASSVQVRPEYVLGLLNSKLLFWQLRRMSNVFRGGWITCTKQYFGELPVRVIDFSNKSEKATHDRIVILVDSMLDLHRKLAATKTPHEETALEREIAATDMQIDHLVYDLYGLTEDEIKIIEGTAESEAEPSEIGEPIAKPKRLRGPKGAYAQPPPAPADASLTPEKAYGDAAHYYSGKEDPVPYRTNAEKEKEDET